MTRDRHLVPLALLVVASVALASFCVHSSASATDVPGFERVAENDYLALYVNRDTAEIAVDDKRSGQVWFSNPPNRDKVETIARGDAKLALGAQLDLSYFAPGDIQRSLDSYIDSVAAGQFEISAIDNGIRVDYVIGRLWSDRDYLPLVVDKDVFEQDILAKITDSRAKRTVESSYVLLTVERATDETSTIAGYVLRSPNSTLSSRDQRTLPAVLVDHLVANTSSIADSSAVTADHLKRFAGTEFYMLRQRERDLLAWDKTAIIQAMKDINLDPALISEGYVKYGIDPRIANVVVFSVPVEYTIDGANLVVRIPAAEIKYPQDVLDSDGRRVSYRLSSIDVLPYFGAADSSQQGYMFVPDGSGALIALNNGKTNLPSYARWVYGSDNGIVAPSQPLDSKQNCLPVFGLKAGEKGFLAIIESGDALAQIRAYIAGKRNSYNTVFAQFTLMARASTSLQGDMPDIHNAAPQWVANNNTVNVYQSDIYRGDVQIRYAFLDGNDSGYQGMARCYQDYLVRRQQLTPLPPRSTVPLYVELIGAISDTRPILGIPREVVVPLTTYEQAKEIASDLVSQGVKGIRLTYTGWMSYGMNHSYPAGVRVERRLGDKSDLLALRDFVDQNGGEVYPSVDFIMVHRANRLFGFVPSRDASRFLNRTVARYQISLGQRPSVVDKNPSYAYVLSPSRLDGLVSRYLSEYDAYGFSGISFGDLGYQLHGDYREGRQIDREKALSIVKAQLAKAVDDHSLKVQVNGANAYAFPYVSSILNLPMTDSGADIVDESVPFVQMVLHGYIDYAGDPANFALDHKRHILKLLETGSFPYYLGYYADPSLLKGSAFDYLYTGKVDDWLKDAVDVYSTLGPVFEEIQDQRIVDHKKLEADVYETVYSNGMSVVVNYSDSAVVIRGEEIEPTGYRVYEEGDYES